VQTCQAEQHHFDAQQQRILEEFEAEVLLIDVYVVETGVGDLCDLKDSHDEDGEPGSREEDSQHDKDSRLEDSEKRVAYAVVVGGQLVLGYSPVVHILEFVQIFGVFVLVVLLPTVQEDERRPGDGADQTGDAQNGVERARTAVELQQTEPERG
jgi:hypothetical protein